MDLKFKPSSVSLQSPYSLVIRLTFTAGKINDELGRDLPSETEGRRKERKLKSGQMYRSENDHLGRVGWPVNDDLKEVIMFCQKILEESKRVQKRDLK